MHKIWWQLNCCLWSWCNFSTEYVKAMFWLIVLAMKYGIFMDTQAGKVTWQYERYIYIHNCYTPTKLIHVYLSKLSSLYVPCFVWPISHYNKGLLVEISKLFQLNAEPVCVFSLCCYTRGVCQTPSLVVSLK